MRRAAASLCVMLLAACAPAPRIGLPERATRGAVSVAGIPALPPMRRFAGPPDIAIPPQPNAQLARDVMALTFRLESGRALTVLTRFEGPVTVAVEAVDGIPPPATLLADLDDLIVRLRAEAGIDIARAEPGAPASITVAALPRATLARRVPGAACFVVPRVSGWRDYLARRHGPATDWTALRVRTRASILLPADAAPQEIRDCLHEELAQALGPLNDLYRLPHSVFNDDDVHRVLTPFDMLILRATYHPALRSGMRPAEVAARLPAILAEVNPQGRRTVPGAQAESPAAFDRAIRGAFDPRLDAAARAARAEDALGMALAWRDDRTALAWLALGRALASRDGDRARRALSSADALYRGRHGDGLRTAQVAPHLAAFALARGRVAEAAARLDAAIPAARGAQDAGLLATLLLMRAEAARRLGAADAATALRREAEGWGRYAWGDRGLATREAEVAGLPPGA